MKKEVRTLLMQTLDCGDTYVMYALLRGLKGLEHVGLVKGTYVDALNRLKETSILDEVNIVITDFYDLKEPVDAPGVKEYLPFLKKLIDETSSLICLKHVTS
ncbi:MAG: hypothetical protein DRO10_02360 [Thermoprotei archaeon]|nr:MAG: hypothetical protein DRO10_02360 [Thermoprotei archaeon]HDN02132.1 hypothetical protein [Candidatus Bathyarchaeota archaeon]